MASAVTHTDKNTTPLTYHHAQLLFIYFCLYTFKKLLFYLLYFTPYKSGLIIFNTITSKPIFM